MAGTLGAVHLSEAELAEGLAHIKAAPSDEGELRLIALRPAVGDRHLPTSAELDLTLGVVGDNWLERGSRHTETGEAHPECQVTVMSFRVASLVAGSPERVPLAGDQLYVDLDLSLDNLPPGSQLRIGSAVLEVSEHPHTGCAKFVDRFGGEAMKFVNGRVGRALRLRGVNTRVVVPGTVSVGDHVTKVSPAV